MDTGDVIEDLRDAHPARQHGDVGDEGDIAHEQIALGPGISSEHRQFSLVGGEAENGVERGGLSCAVRADEPEDAAFFDTQIDAVERDRGAERLAETACFDGCHDLGVSSSVLDISLVAAASNSSAVKPRRWMVAWMRGHCSARNF